MSIDSVLFGFWRYTNADLPISPSWHGNDMSKFHVTTIFTFWGTELGEMIVYKSSEKIEYVKNYHTSY